MKPSNLINKLGKDNSVDNNKAIESLRKIGGNKQCFDCSEKGVTYVVPKIGIFVCSRCAGIHREIGYMVKGLGVSNFSETEINFIKEMGNDNCQKIWMGKFNPSKHSLPKTTDDNSVKDFLKLKYIDKKYYSTGNDENKDINEKGTKVKNNYQDEEIEEDLKPENLKKKEKDVSTKMKNVIIGDNNKNKTDVVEQQIEKSNKPLTKLSISGTNKKESGVKNNDSNWNPNFSNNTNSNINNPFDFENSNNTNTNNNMDFEFPSSENNTPNNVNDDPFGWGNNTVKIVNQTNEKKQSTKINDPFEFNFVNNTTTNSENKKSEFLIVDDDSLFTKHSDTNNTTKDNNKSNNKNIDDIVNMLNTTNLNNDTSNKNNNTFIPSNINFNISNNLYGHPGMLNNQFLNPQDLMLQISQNPQLLNMLNSMVQNQNMNHGNNNNNNNMNQGMNFQTNTNNLNNIDFSMNYQNNKKEDNKVHNVVSFCFIKGSEER